LSYLLLEKCLDLFSSVFTQFNEENLHVIEGRLEEHGLEWVLNKEITFAFDSAPPGTPEYGSQKRRQ
jgi:hypothetical protein